MIHHLIQLSLIFQIGNHYHPHIESVHMIVLICFFPPDRTVNYLLIHWNCRLFSRLMVRCTWVVKYSFPVHLMSPYNLKFWQSHFSGRVYLQLKMIFQLCINLSATQFLKHFSFSLKYLRPMVSCHLHIWIVNTGLQRGRSFSAMIFSGDGGVAITSLLLLLVFFITLLPLLNKISQSFTEFYVNLKLTLGNEKQTFDSQASGWHLWFASRWLYRWYSNLTRVI